MAWNAPLIVDDTPSKASRNYGNAVYPKLFEGDQTDRELELLGRYLVRLADLPNFRCIGKTELAFESKVNRGKPKC